MYPDLLRGVEVFWAIPTLILDLSIVNFVEVLQVFAPQKGLKIWTYPTFPVMKLAHVGLVVVVDFSCLGHLSTGVACDKIWTLVFGMFV